MTSINLRPDDSGIQSLKKENTTSQPTPAREVSALAPSARAHSVTEQPPLPPQTQSQPAVYQGVERRKGERRKGEKRVILDTRDKRERRRQVKDAPDIGDDVPKVGIDVYS